MNTYGDKTRKYYKYIKVPYHTGNAGGMYHYWDEYRAGATCAYITLPEPLVLTAVNMQIGGWTNEFHQGLVCNIWVSGSNDGVNWTGIKGFGDRSGHYTWHILDCSENKTAYRRYYFYAENGGWAYNDALSVAYVEYVGYYISDEEVETPSKDNYDYYIDFVKPKLCLSNNKYYALKSYEKGQYYGN